MVESGYRELIVLRHAKTEQVASSDRARRLTARGRGDARAAGRWLRDQDLAPDLVLTSPAVRARVTADLVVEEVGTTSELQVVNDLYGASVEETLELLGTTDDSALRLLIVGHNPTMAELVHELQENPDGPWAPHLPTAGLALLRLTGSWSDVHSRAARLTNWHVPRG